MKRETFDYTAYLDVKKTIDDHSLNPEVWDAFSRWTGTRQSFNILEIGAGTGTMIIRLLEAGILNHCIYTAVEIQQKFGRHAGDNIAGWCKENGFHFNRETDSTWLVGNARTSIEIRWTEIDVRQIHRYFRPASFDLLLGHAVIDLLHVPVLLPKLFECVVAGSAFYFSLNYAGQTVFQPPHDSDDRILQAYHKDMDGRFEDPAWKASKCGEMLGSWLEARGHRIIAEGPSDWQLPTPSCPEESGRLFVGNILDTMENALPGLEGVAGWLETRRRQLRKGELQFQASNRDYFGLLSTK